MEKQKQPFNVEQRKNKRIFFYKDKEEIIENKEIDAYIENIKEDKFYGGIIEIGIFAKLHNLNIIIYKDDENDIYI